jgi:hypothetical protein
VEESGAVPTHDGADEILKGKTADFLNDLSAEWHENSKDINEERMNK